VVKNKFLSCALGLEILRGAVLHEVLRADVLTVYAGSVVIALRVLFLCGLCTRLPLRPGSLGSLRGVRAGAVVKTSEK